jgi:hypothetical protein
VQEPIDVVKAEALEKLLQPFGQGSRDFSDETTSGKRQSALRHKKTRDIC